MSMERYTEAARRVGDYALRDALSKGHNYIGLEHLEAGIKRARATIVCPHCGQPMPNQLDDARAAG